MSLNKIPGLTTGAYFRFIVFFLSCHDVKGVYRSQKNQKHLYKRFLWIQE